MCDDDDGLVPRDYQFTLIVKHFELSSYLSNFAFLKGDLRDKMSNPATLEILAVKFHQCFIEVIERYITEEQIIPYANLSSERNKQVAAAATAMAIPAGGATGTSVSALPRKMKEVAPRPDSRQLERRGPQRHGGDS